MFRIVAGFRYVLLFLMALCVYAHARGLWRGQPDSAHRASKWVREGLALCAALLCAYVAKDMFTSGWIAVLYLCAFLLMGDFLSLVLRLWPRARAVYRSLLGRGLAFLLALICVGWGAVNMRWVHATHYDVHADAPIGNMRFMLISDLHLGTVYGADEFAQMLGEWLADEAPDALILAGDIVDERTPQEETRALMDALSRVCETMPVYAVLGNHDAMRTNASFGDDFAHAMTRAGIHVLSDELALLGEGVWIAGRKDVYLDANRTPVDALIGAHADDFVILVDHQPRDAEEASRAGADLMLSGHTHDGQLFPVGLIAKWIGYWDLSYGIAARGGMTQIVSSGVAGWGGALRTQGVSEYVIVDIEGA